MKYAKTSFIQSLTIVVIAASSISLMELSNVAAAQLALVDTPLFLTGAVAPKVMLDVSRDHQMFTMAYNDFSDLNNDGTLETTYDHGQDYYGYFDSYKCYNYVSANKRFEPTTYNAKVGTDAASAANLAAKRCSSAWSGNFLNWISMSRMDVVRKLLYGGQRSTDTTLTTTLERALIPQDSHAWAKYYNEVAGDARRPGLDQLTPFTASQFNASPPTGTAKDSKTLGSGSMTFSNSMTLSNIALGDQIKASIDASKYMIGYVTAASSTSVTIQVDASGVTGSGSASAWTLTNLTQTGITFCNATIASSGGSETINTSVSPPTIRVAKGNYALWTVNDGKQQCGWSNEASTTNGNIASKSEIYANRNRPSSTVQGLLSGSVGPEFIARVQACASDALIGSERCKKYGTVWKPIGLLQVYGEPTGSSSTSNLINFGLMTGSYSRNKSGGVLRKNIGAITDEIDQTNGLFIEPGTTNPLTINPTSSAGYSSSGQPGIIKTLSRLRMYGYDFATGNYGSGSDNCNAPNILNPTDDQCSSWGNPASEMYAESLRYLAGKTSNTAFTNSGTLTKDAKLGLPIATWTDPILSSEYCAPLNILNFNSSVSSYDGNAATIVDLAGSPDIATWTNQVGVGEGFAGNYMVGDNGLTNDNSCTPKSFTTLSAMKGLCPEAPTMGGSYLMAGAAYYARSNKIRTDITTPADNTTSLKVKTYGVALSTNTPKIKIPVPGSSPTRYITIMPAFRVMANSSTFNGAGEIVGFKVVRQASDGTPSGTSGKFYVVWDDAPQANDYDLDVWGYISYRFTDATHIEIKTEIVSAAQGYGSAFGFNISGVDSGNGVHYLSANRGSGNNVNIIWPTGCSGSACEVNATSSNVWGPVAKSFSFSSSSNSNALEEPLWYASKWGGYDDLNKNSVLDSGEWDKQLNSNGAIGSDGMPDTYFFASDPRILENSLNQAFLAVLSDASSSSVAASSTKLNTNTNIFEASFNSSDWSGKLQAFKVDSSNGSISSVATWNAGEVINSQNYSTGRNIFTLNPSAFPKGVPFRWTSLSATQQAYLNKDPDNANVAEVAPYQYGAKRVDYLRGDGSNEGNGSTTANKQFRLRQVSKLGDIINSSPYYLGAPDSGYSENDYASFKNANSTRSPMIYVGANDGMMHGFDAATGQEKVAYIPNKILPNLNKLTSRVYNAVGNHRYFLDGSPSVGDAYINGRWKSVLVSGLGHGGRGIFALDVTNPTNFAESATNAGNLALWEFTDADDSDLGFTYGQVTIGKVCTARSNGSCTTSKWAAIFGNGYNNTDSTAGVASTSGKAALYILLIEDAGSGWTLGTNFFKITTTGSVATPNGLAAVAPVDLDDDGHVDFVYAGDLLGNLERFDLTGSAGNWTYNTLFSAKDSNAVAQPITSRPEVGRHSTGVGVMIYVGTGRYLATGDNATSGQQTQTFYGVWDKTVKNGLTWTLGATVQRSGFLQQKILQETTDADGNPVRITSDKADGSAYKMDWKVNTGWYIDLYNTQSGNVNNFGEKQVTDSVLQNKQIEFATLIPDASACEAGGSGWIMKLDPDDGSRIDAGAFLLINNNPVLVTAMIAGVSVPNTATSGVKSRVGIPSKPTIVLGESGMRYEYISGSKQKGPSGSTVDYVAAPVGPRSSGRISWREIVN